MKHCGELGSRPLTTTVALGPRTTLRELGRRTPDRGDGRDPDGASWKSCLDVLRARSGTLAPLSTSSLAALGNSPQCFIDDLATRSAHSCIPNLLPTNQTALDRLPESLSNEVPFHRASLDEVENRPKWPSEFEALSRLHVALGQIGIVKYENTRNIAV